MRRKRLITKGRLSMLSLALVVALAGMGVGYAQMQGNLLNNDEVLADSSFTWVVSNDDGSEDSQHPYGIIDPGDDGGGANYDGWGPLSSDDPSEPQTMGVECARYDKDVARTTAGMSDDQRKITVVVENAYPSYYPTVFFELANTQTFPIEVGSIDIVIDNSYPEALTVTTSGIDEGQPIPPGGEVTGAVRVRVEQAAAQNAVYTFTVSIVLRQTAAISIEKVASPTTVADAGTIITYTYTVTNIGAVPLTGITVTDDPLGPITLDRTTLGPDEFATGTATYTVTADDIAAGGDIFNVATVTTDQGVTAVDVATVRIVVIGPVVGGGGAGLRYLTVDWEGRNTTRSLYGNNRLTADLLGLSPDTSDNLFLERGTQAPVVGRRTHYLIVVRELEEIPPLPENTVALAAVNITPKGAVFDRDIFLTLGLDELELPENILNIAMAYYDDVNEVWQNMEFEAGGPTGVAELTLSVAINHFSIFAVLVEIAPTALPPARFVASGLTIVPSVERIWEAVTFVTRTGESATVTANITNEGGQAGVYTVELKLNGEVVDSKVVMLGAGQSQQVQFTLSEMDYGQYQVEVIGVSGTLTVLRTINWWLIIGIIAAIGLIAWGVVWRRRRKAHKEA